MAGESSEQHRILTFGSEVATERFAALLGVQLKPGQTVLLSGEIGAGKSVFARAALQAMMAEHGDIEHVPSPTYTIVQTYDVGPRRVWHCDLYRLGDSSEIEELGLLDAFETDIVFVEWPDRLGADIPGRALHVRLSATDVSGQRTARIHWFDPNWTTIVNHAAGGVRDPA